MVQLLLRGTSIHALQSSVILSPAIMPFHNSLSDFNLGFDINKACLNIKDGSPYYFPLYQRGIAWLWWWFLVLQILDTPSLLAEGSAGVRKNIFKQKPPESDASTSGCCWNGCLLVFFMLSFSFVEENDVITWRWQTMFPSFTFVVCTTECSSVFPLSLIWYLKMKNSFLFCDSKAKK